VRREDTEREYCRNEEWRMKNGEWRMKNGEFFSLP
jgi:hypothetical protein